MNCLKAVILLWTGIIAFNASVTAYEVGGKDIRELYEHYCGAKLKSLEVYFVDIHNDENKELFDIVYKIPDATVGPLRHLTIPFDQVPCDKGLRHKFHKIELSKELMESTMKQLQFTPLEEEISRK